MYGKSNIETYIATCKIDSKQIWSGKLKQELCISLEGWVGREMVGEVQKGGIYVYLWLIHVEVCQKITEFHVAIILQ